MTKRALVCGAGGFIGSHLVKRLVDDGYWVRGVDIKHPEWTASPADEFLIGDLRDPSAAVAALKGGFDEVYQLAADHAQQHVGQCQHGRSRSSSCR